MKHTLSVLVEDESGALSRIAGLFARRGFNIDSLAVGPAEADRQSRLTMVVEGDDQSLHRGKQKIVVHVQEGACDNQFSTQTQSAHGYRVGSTPPYILLQKKVRIFPGVLRPLGPPHLGLLGQAAWGLSPVGGLWIPFKTKNIFLLFSFVTLSLPAENYVSITKSVNLAPWAPFALFDRAPELIKKRKKAS